VENGAGGLTPLREALQAVNEALWETEDALRDCESRQDFGDGFVALARSVYGLNDRRGALKRQVNDRLGVRHGEHKQYGQEPAAANLLAGASAE
jgi:hypothetical protein